MIRILLPLLLLSALDSEGQQTARKHSVTPGVSIMDTSFFIPQLNRTRRIWIYLPPGYNAGRKKYPVLYMHDGQNLFSDSTSYAGEWGVDEAADTLGKAHGEMIIVGIDNGPRRMNEYAPYDMKRFGEGEGDEYTDFIAKTLHSYIKKKYRVKTGKQNTFIAGSSMGGLISFHAILRHPNVFGGAGVFSPSFWVNEEFRDIPQKIAKKVKGKIFFYAGQKEGDTMVADMLNVFGQMEKKSKAKMQTVIRSEGQHNERTWRAEFPGFYRFILK